MNENLPSILPTSDFQVLQVIADNASKSGLYAGVGSQQKILMVLLAAREMGVPPMQALNGRLWNIQGKIEISSRLMSSMIRRAGHSINIIQCDSKTCILEGKRKDNGDIFKSEFSIEDANKAGLSGRDVWKKYTEDMLYSRALSRLARRLFADVIGTAYVEGEIRDVEVEVINKNQPIIEEAPKVEVSKEESDKALFEFSENFLGEDPQLIRAYLEKYSNHYKKSIPESIQVYSNHEEFLKDFKIFKSRPNNKKAA